MGDGAALFFFLAVAVVAVFAFLSVAVWVNGPTRERFERDRIALLKSIAEQPGENAARVLEWLREQDRNKEEKEAAEKREGLLMAGFFMVPIGVILYYWVGIAGLFPLVIGVVLLGFGVVMTIQAKR